MDSLDAMRTFVAVARAESFSAAARTLRVSPSAVTRGIAQLESHLGRPLLARTTRAVRLTEPGRAYLARAVRILDDVRDAEGAVRGDSATLEGRLVVAAPVMLGRLHVIPIAAALLAAHPRLELQLALSDRYAHLVDDNIDVAVRVGELSDSSAISTRLTTVTRVVVASPGYLAARGTPRTPAQLAGHDAIASNGLERTDEWQFARGVSVRVAPRLIVDGADAALAAAEADLGIARVLSYQAAGALGDGRLVELLARHAPPALPIHAVYPARRASAAAVTAFLDLARRHFAT